MESSAWEAGIDVEPPVRLQPADVGSQYEHVMRRTEQALLHEADRREELVVNRAAHAPAALGGKHADHPERLIFDAHGLADRRAVAEQILGQSGTQNGDRRPGATLCLIEQGSAGRP